MFRRRSVFLANKWLCFAASSVVLVLAGCGSIGFSSDTTALRESSFAPSSSSSEAPTTQVVTTATNPQSLSSAEIASIPSSGQPFLLGLTNAELPQLPTEIPGFVRYNGSDANGPLGAIRTNELRLFEGDLDIRLVSEFTTQMNGCNDAIWVLRWISKNEDVVIQSTNEVDGMAVESFEEPPEENPFAPSVADESWFPDATTSGIMSGSICSQPGFHFGRILESHPSIPPSATLVVDLVLEWSYYDRDYFAGE
jgi:hypothetical protein